MVVQIAWVVTVYSFALHFLTSLDTFFVLLELCVTFEHLSEQCLISVLFVDIVIIVIINIIMIIFSITILLS